MDKVLAISQWIVLNYQVIISALIGICTGLISISLLIPGEQPEKALQGFVDFLAKFSAKKVEEKK